MSACRLGVAVVLLFAAGCMAPALPPEPPPLVSPIELDEGEWRVVEHVFVVTDASGTMYDSGAFPRAKALSQGFVAALPSPRQRARSEVYNAGNIGFGGEARVALSLSSFDRAVLRASVDRVEVMGEVDGSGGSTPLHHVIREIAQQLEGLTGTAAVVLFSDGTTNDAAALLEEASDLVRDHRDGVCFHTVVLGHDPEGARTLRALAEISAACGSFSPGVELRSARAMATFAREVMVANTPSVQPFPPVGTGTADPAAPAAPADGTSTSPSRSPEP